MPAHPACTSGVLAGLSASPAALASCAVSPLAATDLAYTEAHASAGLQERGLPHSLPARRSPAKDTFHCAIGNEPGPGRRPCRSCGPCNAWQDRAGRARAGPHPRVEGARRDVEAADLVVQAAVAAVSRQALYDLRAGSTHSRERALALVLARTAAGARASSPGPWVRAPHTCAAASLRARRARRARTPFRSCCRLHSR